MGWITAFMTHSKATPIYQALPFLALVQFSWRFLTLVIFAFSFLVGAIVLFVRKSLISYVAVFLSLAIIIAGWSYFLPQGGRMGKLSDEEKFSGAAWDLQQTAGIYFFNFPQIRFV